MFLVLLNASVLNPKLVFVKYMANTEICDKMFDILLTSSPVMENMARNVSLAVLDWYNGIMVYGPHYGVIGEQLHEAGNKSLSGQWGKKKKANWRIMWLIPYMWVNIPIPYMAVNIHQYNACVLRE